MAYWVYTLKGADSCFYVGHTDALEARTAKRQPVALVWSQDFGTRIATLEAERQIKGWSRAKKLALIAGDWRRISQLERTRAASGAPTP